MRLLSHPPNEDDVFTPAGPVKIAAPLIHQIDNNTGKAI